MEIEVLLFELDRYLFGIEAEHVTEVLRAVALSPLPRAPSEVTGVINLRGQIVPVINTRKALGFKELPVRHTDHFVVVQQDKLVFALHLDRAVDLIRLSSEADEAGETANPSPSDKRPLVKRILKAEAGMVQVLDLNSILSIEDRKTLAGTLSSTTAKVMQQQSP